MLQRLDEITINNNPILYIEGTLNKNFFLVSLEILYNFVYAMAEDY